MPVSFYIVIIMLLIFSVCCVAAIPARLVYRRLQKKMTGGSRLVPLLLLFCAVWALRFAVNLYNGYLNDTLVLGKLFVWEQMVDAAIHALQSFSMDEDYTEYQELGKAMMRELSGSGSVLVGIYSVYATLLNIASPVCGGALLLDVLADIFPGLAVHGKFWRRKVWFSQLDAGALTLARQILVHERKGLFNKPLIVFTDAYKNENEEESSEIYYAAREIGAACLKQDLRSMTLSGLRDHRVILNDSSEIENLKLLAALTDREKMRHLHNVRFFVFYDNDRFSTMESDISERLDALCREKYGTKISGADKKYIRRAAAAAGIQGSDSAELLRALAVKQLNEEHARTDRELTSGEKRLLRWSMDPNSTEYQRVFGELQEQQNRKPTEAEIWEKLTAQAVQAKKQNGDLPTEAEIRKKQTQLEQKFLTEAEAGYLPAITRIQLYQNLVITLFKTRPIYRTQLTKKQLPGEPEPIRVMILGAGKIGLQAIRTASWFGQMYDHLQIGMAALEDPESIRAELNRVCPELLKSTGDRETLALYGDGESEEYAEPYFDFAYSQCDLTELALEDVVCQDWNTGEQRRLLDADYFIVALGSDELNISVADELRRLICIQRFRQEAQPEKLINYVVFDPELNRVCRERDRASDRLNTSMYAFGSMEDLYTPESIFGDIRSQFSQSANQGYCSLSTAEVYAESRQRIKNSYNYWSSAARTAHLHYRMYSAWRYLQTIDAQQWAEFEKNGHPDYERYLQAIQAEPAYSGCDDLDNYLTWLEHRRWNAYIRAVGFAHTAHGKDFHLRLHECLVECVPGFSGQRKDRLDQLGSYKVYDAPCAVDCELIMKLFADRKDMQ